MKKASLAKSVISAALPLLSLMAVPRSAAGEVAGSPRILSWSNSKTNNQDTAFPVKKGEKITFNVKAEGAQEYRWWINKELQKEAGGKSFTWTVPNDKGMWKIHVTATNNSQEQDIRKIIDVVKGTKEAQENWDRRKISTWGWSRWPWMLDAIYPSRAQKEWTVSTFVKQVKPGESIQSAVDSVPAEGGIVLLAAGTHKVPQGGTAELVRRCNYNPGGWTRINNDHWTQRAPIDYGILLSKRKNIAIKGAGMKKTTVITTTDRHTYHLFLLVEAADISIKDMFITSKEARSHNDPGCGVGLWTCRDITVDNVKVEKMHAGIGSGPGIGSVRDKGYQRTDRVILSNCIFNQVKWGYNWCHTHNSITKDSEFSHCGMYGVSFNAASSNGVVTRCRCHHNGLTGIEVYTNRNFVIKDNICYENEVYGIWVVYCTRNVKIMDNICRDNGNPRRGTAIGGIGFSPLPAGAADDVTISGNLIYNNRGHGVNIPTSRRGLISKKYGPFHLTVESNTIFSNKGDGIAHDVNRFESVVRNNIIVNNAGYGISHLNDKSTLTLSHNNVWSNSKGNYNRISAGAGDVSAAPLFADPAKGDFHLKSKTGRWDPKAKKWVKDAVTSPCIDAGESKANHSREPAPNGGRVNMGAYGNTKEASKSTVQ